MLVKSLSSRCRLLAVISLHGETNSIYNVKRLSYVRLLKENTDGRNISHAVVIVWLFVPLHVLGVPAIMG
jgi:hypothetical protein